MTETLQFLKCSGAGNDFVVIDNMDASIRSPQADLARALCSRPFGIGADGLLVLERSDRADFGMKYYNADGSYGGMCGNGGRCIAMVAHKKGYGGTSLHFDALDHVYEAEIFSDSVRLHMKNPLGLRLGCDIRVAGGTQAYTYVDTGSPHVVVFENNLASTEVVKRGKELRFHDRFKPAGTNVDFVQVQSASSIEVRTYERGVENETLACGTGSVAAAVVAALVKKCRPPIEVHVRSGESLRVDFNLNNPGISEATLQGSAHILFEGCALYDSDSRKIQCKDLTGSK